MIGYYWETYSHIVEVENVEQLKAIGPEVLAWTDNRRSTCFTRFNFNAYTGEKIDWPKIRKELKAHFQA